MPTQSRDTLKSIKLTDYEFSVLLKAQSQTGMNASELIRACLALGIPQLLAVPFLRRLRLEDNIDFNEKQ